MVANTTGRPAAACAKAICAASAVLPVPDCPHTRSVCRGCRPPPSTRSSAGRPQLMRDVSWAMGVILTPAKNQRRRPNRRILHGFQTTMRTQGWTEVVVAALLGALLPAAAQADQRTRRNAV